MKKPVAEKKDKKSSARNVFALGFVSFFTDMSSEMVFSLLPTFLLGLPGSSRAVLGLIEGTAEALSYALRAVSGFFSDKFRKRKPFVLIGYALSNAVKPLFAVARVPIDVFVIRVSERVGKGVRTSPRDTLLCESVSEKRRGAAFGLHRTLDQAGAIVGPVVASAAMLILGFTIRDVFWLSLIPGTIALFIILFLVKERASKSTSEFKLLAGIKSALKGNFSLLLVIVGVFSLGAFNFSFVLLNAQEAGIADSLIPLVYAAVNVAHTAIAIPAGVLSDRIGKEKVMVLGYGIFLSTTLLILFPASGYVALLVAVMYGAYIGVVETVQRALIPDYVEKGLRGTAYGIYYLVVGSAFFVSNAVVGTLWEYFGSSAASTYSITLSAVAIVAMIVFVRRKM
ncbi:MAG TPA: MFS transporter [Candidatus Bathyarchaeota archaeon]|nr:MFS transporter [Candidatus Bathyarchaeota archaeon]